MLFESIMGSFKVAAQFVKYDEGKIHLHKHNGVRIAVPTFRLCVEDLEYVEKATGVLLKDKRMVASRASPSSSHLDVEA